MNTEKAKNVVIIMLVILNAVIFQFNKQRADAYLLTLEQEKAITEVLKRNRITLYTTIINDFKPLKPMAMSEFDYSVLEKILFKDVNSEDIYEMPEFDKVNKYSPIGRLTLYGDSLDFFSQRSGLSNNSYVISEAEARDLCESFLDELTIAGDLNFNFSLTYSQYHNNTYNLLYLGEYNGTIIASNTVRFTVDDLGIAQLRCSLAIPEGLTGVPREIYSADEALLELSRKIKDDYPDFDFFASDSVYDGSIRIMDMKIVYYLNEKTGGSPSADPYYMFTVKWDSVDPGSQRRYGINAYTNMFIRF